MLRKRLPSPDVPFHRTEPAGSVLLASPQALAPKGVREGNGLGLCHRAFLFVLLGACPLQYKPCCATALGVCSGRSPGLGERNGVALRSMAFSPEDLGMSYSTRYLCSARGTQSLLQDCLGPTTTWCTDRQTLKQNTHIQAIKD